MKNAILIILATLIFVSFWARASDSAQPGDEQRQVQAALDTFIAALEDLDWERFIEAFTEDATIFLYPSVSEGKYPLRTGIREGFWPIFQRNLAAGLGERVITPEDVRIETSSDMAVASFHLYRGGGVGHRTIVFRRETNGWKITHIHASVYGQSEP